MAISQNARFSGEAAPDAEFEHPPGRSIARLLRDALAKQGWKVSDIENWRDGGWSVTCCRDGSKLELIVAKMAVGPEWLLQIAPSYTPGLIGWIMSKHASAQPETILALAKDVHSALSRSDIFRGFMWCWGNFPEQGNSTPEPVPA